MRALPPDAVAGVLGALPMRNASFAWLCGCSCPSEARLPFCGGGANTGLSCSDRCPGRLSSGAGAAGADGACDAAVVAERAIEWRAGCCGARCTL